MALGTDNLIDDADNCHAHLVNNYSVSSFITENHELTITRSFGDRKYSTMCFKPMEKNTVDIVITQGEYSRDKPALLFKDIGSRDLREKYSTKAKLGVAFVFIMLIVMIVFVILCLLSSPANYRDSGTSGKTAIFQDTNTTSPSTENIATVLLDHIVDTTPTTLLTNRTFETSIGEYVNK